MQALLPQRVRAGGRPARAAWTRIRDGLVSSLDGLGGRAPLVAARRPAASPACRARCATACSRGAADFTRIDHLDFREWLARNGARAETLDSPLVRGLYDLVFAYEGGDPDAAALRRRPRAVSLDEAVLRLQGRDLLEARGGDGRRRVRAALRGAARARRAVRVLPSRRRAAPRRRAPRDRRDRPRTPGPARRRRRPVRAARARAGTAVFSVRAAARAARGRRRRRSRVRVGRSHGRAAGHAARGPRLRRRHPRDVDRDGPARSAASCSSTTRAGARWSIAWPPSRRRRCSSGCAPTRRSSGGRTRARRSAATRPPFETYASMTHTLPFEDWPDGDEAAPRAVAYFCSVLAPDEALDPAVAACPRAGRRPVVSRARRRALLARRRPPTEPSAGSCWPAAISTRSTGARTSTRPIGTSSRCRAAGARGCGPTRRATTTSFLAGDWIDCGLNAGCVEAATIAGIQAANAVRRRPLMDGVLGMWCGFETAGSER